MKKCRKCNIEKDESEYHKDKRLKVKYKEIMDAVKTICESKKIKTEGE
jgi:hypothetical protein